MTPKRLPRDSAERVLRRAVELGDQPGAADDSFDPEVLIAAATELGVSTTAVQRALAEEHAGLLVGEPSRLDRLVGPAVISSARVVALDAASALELTDAWLRSQWAFKRVRGTDAVAEYRRRTDMVASMQRTARSMSGKDNADKVRNLRVVVHDLPSDAASAETAIVAVLVDLESSRTFAEMGAGAVAGGGTFLSAVGTVASMTATGVAPLVQALPLLGIPLSAGMGIGVLATRKAWTGGIDVALEGLLDHVESGQQPPTVLRGISDRLRGGPQRSADPERPRPGERPGPRERPGTQHGFVWRA